MIDIDHVIRARTELGLSQRQLAKRTGVNRETIRRLENGADPFRLTLAVLERLASALRLHPGDLFVDMYDRQDDTDQRIELDPAPLDHNSARLLRRIHRGEDIRRTLSRTDRELTLPKLVRRQLVTPSPAGIHVSDAVQIDCIADSQPTQRPTPA